MGQETSLIGRMACGWLVGVAALCLAACAADPASPPPPGAGAEAAGSTLTHEATPEARAEVAPQAAPVELIGKPAEGQELFASATEAVKAALGAAKVHDHKALEHVFGPAGKELVSGDRVEDRNDREAFVKSAAQHMRLEAQDDHTTILHVGTDDWPFPIPIVKTPEGKWFFDTEAGKQEILARRIGDNELETIDVCRAYVEAQRQYAGKDRDGSGVLKYAQLLVSDPGKKNGLYWKTKAGEPESPLGPLIAEARAEGYTKAGKTTAAPAQPYHGYYYRILTQQGAAVPGGAYDYVINGNMIAGFALVAYPDKYGASGIMTFIVNHQGKVYQKDLGPQTGDAAGQIQEYNPDSTWTVVKD